MDERISVEVDGRLLTLTNLGKVLYPAVGFTKGEVIDYYTRIAPVLLPHLADRPVTFTRWPDGVQGQSFFGKNVPSHAPSWLRTVVLPAPGSTLGRDEIRYAIIDGLAALVWAANLAALELHVPQWRVTPEGTPREPDLLVLDLDPGPPATIVECCTVALRLRARLAEEGLAAYPKSSGSKGMQLYLPVTGSGAQDTSGTAKRLAVELERDDPALVVSRMAKDARRGKVFVDWSQNNAAKTTIAAYSLRAREQPTVSTPLSWPEVEACRQPEDLRFTAAQVLARVAADGDLLDALGAGY